MSNTPSPSVCVIWFTGLSASGKTTLAESFAEKFNHISDFIILDGDEIRKAQPNLGYSKKDRLAQVSRVADMAAEHENKGKIVLVALISPYQKSRTEARKRCHKFFEIYVSTPLEVCISRDPKGLYRKALAQQISNFTGISDPYESPVNPDLTIDTSIESLETSLLRIYHLITEGQIF